MRAPSSVTAELFMSKISITAGCLGSTEMGRDRMKWSSASVEIAVVISHDHWADVHPLVVGTQKEAVNEGQIG